MPLAVPQLELLNPHQWVTIEEAARLTGKAVRTWSWRARQEADQATRTGRQSLAIKAQTPDGRGRHGWYVHRSLCQDPRRDEQSREALAARHTSHQVAHAYRKAHWLRKWRKTIEHSRLTEREAADRIIAEARQIDGETFKISFRSLQAWHKAYYTTGPNRQLGIEGLIDGRSAPNRSSGDTPRCGRSPEAIDYFYSLFHTENKLSATLCHEHAARKARAQGWAWPASYSATRKWIARHDNVALSYLLRFGPDAWCRRYMPHQLIDYTLIEPGQMFQTDHHQVDFWVLHDGEQLRPWLTVVQDMRSRCIVGWHLGATPHQDAILAAYLMAFRDWAIPEKLRIDNGKDFASELLTGVTKATRDSLRRQYGREWKDVLRRDEALVGCVDRRFLGITEELGIDTIYAIPYAPWSKGTTERWFGTFEDRCGKTFATYCGNTPQTRPECLEAIRKSGDVPMMEDARAAIEDYITEYHHTPHSADDMAGRTPFEVWQTATHIRKAGDEEVLFLMQSRGVYKVGANGVTFKVGGGRLTYGGGNPALYRYVGREVFITLDPGQTDHCFAFTADAENRRFIARLESNERISPMATVDDLRAAQAKVQRQRKRQRQAQCESPNRTRTVAQELAVMRKERASELRATGTDNARPKADIVPVRTGFEGAVKTVRNAAGPGVDRKSRDLSVAKAALGFGRGLSPQSQRRHVSDDLLRGRPIQATEAVKDDDGTDGKDAGHTSSTEILRLIGETRHERTDE